MAELCVAMNKKNDVKESDSTHKEFLERLRQDVVKETHEAQKVFLETLSQLDASHSDFPYLLSSAAINMCLEHKDVKLGNKIDHYDDLIIKVKMGFEKMKNYSGDLSEEEKDRLDFSRALFTRTFDERPLECKTVQSKTHEYNMRGRIQRNGFQYKANNSNGQRNVSSSLGRLSIKETGETIIFMFIEELVDVEK